MSTLDCLPAELVLRVLTYLPFQSLRNLRLTSRRLNTFFLENESTIYHHAALLHNFIDSIHTLLQEAKAAHPLSFLQDAPNWYHFCRLYFQLQRNWMGAGSATVKFYGGHPYDVHRIKVDEEHNLLITTHEFGGLTVFDLQTTEVLWKLDATYIRRYAHCEYEKGFLIFDRVGISKEVWRLDVLFDASEMPTIFRPSDTQMDAWKSASLQFASSTQRGHFRPWALIEMPESGRAYRFVYPSLLVSGLRKAYVWDVRTAVLTLEVDNVQGNSGGGDINYVELSETHVFVCSTSALRVFSRQDGAMVLDIPSYGLAYSDVRLAVQLDPAVARQKVASPSEGVALPAEPTVSTALYTASYAEFSAVHVVGEGKDFIAQLSDSRLVLVRDFMRVVRGEVPLKTAALEVGKTIPRLGGVDEHFSIYLTSGHNRIGVVTTSGVYAATLDPTHHGFWDEDLLRTGRRHAFGIPQSAIDAGLSFPYLTFVSLPFYHDRRQLAKVTCIQITETKLFFVWDAMYKPDSIDFFRRLGMIGGSTPPPRGGDEDGGGDGDAMGHGLYTAAATLADAAVQTQPSAEAGGMYDDEDGGEWDFQGAEEHQIVLASGSGMLGDTPEAGPSIAADVDVDVDVDGGLYADDEMGADEEDEEYEWEDEESMNDDSDDWQPAQGPVYQNPLNGVARDHNFVSTGPIVFCIDFTPK